MSRQIDISGHTFDRWTVLHLADKQRAGFHTFWLCECTCGTLQDVDGNSLRRRKSKSCGCWNREATSLRVKAKPPALRHGHARRGLVSREYNSYRSAIDRCTDPTATSWAQYGGRGIKFLF